MKINYMTLQGDINKEEFIKQWAASRQRDAAYLQTDNEIFIMPYGEYNEISREDAKVKFAGTHRRHHFIKRDFEIADQIFGGGYLRIAEDKGSCALALPSKDYGPARDKDRILKLANEFFFGV